MIVGLSVLLALADPERPAVTVHLATGMLVRGSGRGRAGQEAADRLSATVAARDG